YSIEDLAQLIYDLKTFKPLARVSVKLVSGPGVGTIAVGVAKANADVVLISGNSGGTGASPMVSIKHAGSPWELGLAEAHQTLVANGLRSTIYLETDGGIRTGRDVVVAALLGADRYGFGTLPLLALGCKMVRQCHENTCPVGIATQEEDLRAKYTGAADQVVALFRHLAEEVRTHLAALGARSIDEILGRADLLVPRDDSLGFADLLARADFRSERSYRTVARSAVGEALALDARRSVRDGAVIELSYPVQNTDRAVGTRLSGEIAAQHGDTGLPPDTVRVWLSGTAGQSLGAFLAPGISLRLTGTANDYVGKGMGGGVIAIRPSVAGDGVPHGAGNACLYGATSGALYISGSVGQRFAVRNSGATAVVEGAGDHCAEYMTGGRVVVLGDLGRNVGAGMTGGVVFIWDPHGIAPAHLAESAPPAVRLDRADAEELHDILNTHAVEADSQRAQRLLDTWGDRVDEFWVVRPDTV
ncbi:MAG: glutamate synthase subunit alpha, partial [Acidimicrobiia bacterium]|nr:glutamate synthase subunit alpha [Acidimicrobiia bacterium]